MNSCYPVIHKTTTLHTRDGVGASLGWGRCLEAAGLGVTVLARLVPIGHTSYQGWYRGESWLGPAS